MIINLAAIDPGGLHPAVRKFFHVPEGGKDWRVAVVLLIAAIVSMWVVLSEKEPPARSGGSNEEGVPKVVSSPRQEVVETSSEAAGDSGVSAGEVAARPAAKERLPVPDRKSISALLDHARRRIMPIEGAAAELPENSGKTHFFQNPGQGLLARTGGGAVHLEVRGTGLQASLRYEGAGEETVVSADGSRVTMAHVDGVVEWLENSAEGIEQGFELPHAVSDSGKRELVVRLGNLSTAYDSNEKDLVWLDENEVPVMAYSGLKVTDTRGEALPAKLLPDGDAFRIVIHDRDAVYPVSVDPVITTLQAIVGPPTDGGDGQPRDGFGDAVATDGERLIVGADRNRGGAVYIYQRQGSDWIYETKILPPATSPASDFGTSLAFDGTQIIVGASTLQGPLTTGGAYEYMKGAVFVYTKNGSSWELTQRLYPDLGPNPEATGVNHHFGTSLAMDGDTLVVGADGAANTPALNGYICVFTRSSGVWTHEARILSPQGQTGDLFGYSVAVEGETLVAGRPGKAAGDAVVFSKQGGVWTEETKFTGVTSGDRFGQSVAISGGAVAVGAVQSILLPTGTRAGSVRVFRKAGGIWDGGTLIPHALGSGGDGFGSSLAFEGNRLLVGSMFYNSRKGGAFAFEWTGSVWQAVGNLLPAVGNYNGAAGWSVALHGDDAFVGAYGAYDSHFVQTGLVHPFGKSGGTWQEGPTVGPGDGNSEQYFGGAVALDDERLLVGMEYDLTSYGNTGSAFVFVRQGEDWNLEAQLMSPDPNNQEGFGRCVAIDGGRLVVGAPGDTGGGSAVAFTFDGGQWIFDAKLKPLSGTWMNEFGRFVSLEGDRVLVAARKSTAGGSFDGGAGYLFRRQPSGWVEESILNPAGIPTQQSAPGKVLLDQGRAYVGFPNFGGTGGAPGAIQEFVESGGVWSPANLIVNLQTTSGTFGSQFAVSGGHLIASQGSDQVYAYKRDGNGVWIPNGQLLSPASPSGLMIAFGSALAIDGGIAAVESFGAVVIYGLDESGWSIRQTLTGMMEDYFLSGGETLAISGNLLAAGFADDDVVHPVTGSVIKDRGSVYLFELGEPYMKAELRNPEGGVVTAGESRDMGTVVVGLTTSELVYKIHNFGTTPVTGLSIATEGADAGHFRITKPANGTVVQPGESVEVRIAFQPTDSGQKNLAVRISSDDVAAGEWVLAATGFGNRRPAVTANSHLVILGTKTVIFLKDLATDADGDALEFVEKAAVSGAWGSYTVFKDRIVFEAAPVFTGQVNMSFDVTDTYEAKSSLSAWVSPAAGQTAGPGSPVVAMGGGRWNISLGGGQPNQSYRVEHSVDMGIWKTLGSAMTDHEGRILMMDHAGAVPTGFYRLAE